MRRVVLGLRLVRPALPSSTHRERRGEPMVSRLRRDQLLIALGWAGALRASELVAVDAEDLHFVGDPDVGDGGLVMRIRRSKTDQAANEQYVAVPYSSPWSSCLVRLALGYTRQVRTAHPCSATLTVTAVCCAVAR